MKKALEIALVLVIVGDTLYFGGVLPLAQGLTEVILFGCVLLVLIDMTRRGRLDFKTPWPLVFFIFLIILQSVPLPPTLVRWLSPSRLSGPTSALTNGAHSIWITLSIYPFATHRSLVLFLAYVAGFVIAAITFDSRRRTSHLIRGLIYLGVFEGAYGIVQYLTGSYKIFTYTNQYYAGNAFGTYINHNDFAGLIELVFPFVMGTAFYYFQWWQEGHLQDGRGEGSALRAPGVRALLYFALVLILMIGVIFSRSRGGILGSILALVFIGGLAILRQQTISRIGILAVAGLIFFVIAYGTWIGLGPVLSRFEHLENPNYVRTEGRLQIWKDTLEVIHEYPVVGSGLGTYAVSYRPFQTFAVNHYVDHAHDDYLEFTAETGIVGGALLFLGIYWLLIKMIISFWTDPRRFRSSVTLGCIGSTLAILIHSVTDFNLHIPANALIFACVLGVGYKISCIERKDEPAPSGHAASSPLPQ